MTAIGFHSAAGPSATGHGAIGHRTAGTRAAWPWTTTLLISLAFFLAVHDVRASQKWQKLAKGEVAALGAEESEGRLSRQLGFLLLGAVGAVLLISGRGRPMRPAPLLAFSLAMVLIWALLSAVWSADVEVTLKRQIVLVCMLVAALGLIRRFEIDRLAEIGFVSALLMMIIGIAADALLAHRGSSREEYRFAGTLHPNHAGINAALLLMCSLFLAHHRADRRFLFVAAAAVAVLLLTKSRTALGATIAGAAVFVVLAWPPRKKLALFIVLLVGLSLAAALTAADLFSHLNETLLLNRQGSDPTTLTGRTMIWDFALSHVREDWGRLLAGFGYGGFWTKGMSQALSQRAHFSLSEGHNAYLDVLLQLGAVGLFFYLCAVLGALGISLAAVRRSASATAAFAVALLVFTVVHHIAESAMTAPTFPTLILWTVVGSAALRQPLDPQMEVMNQ